MYRNKNSLRLRLLAIYCWARAISSNVSNVNNEKCLFYLRWENSTEWISFIWDLQNGYKRHFSIKHMIKGKFLILFQPGVDENYFFALGRKELPRKESFAFVASFFTLLKTSPILIISSFEDQIQNVDNPKCLFLNLDESWVLHFELISIRLLVIFWALLQQFLQVVFVLYRMEDVLRDRNSMFQDKRSTLDHSSLQVDPWCFSRSHEKIPEIVNEICEYEL